MFARTSFVALSLLLTAAALADNQTGTINRERAITADESDSKLGYCPVISIPEPILQHSPADINLDGALNSADIDDFLWAFFTASKSINTDTNADGQITPDDLDDFITLYFEELEWAAGIS